MTNHEQMALWVALKTPRTLRELWQHMRDEHQAYVHPRQVGRYLTRWRKLGRVDFVKRRWQRAAPDL